MHHGFGLEAVQDRRHLLRMARSQLARLHPGEKSTPRCSASLWSDISNDRPIARSFR